MVAPVRETVSQTLAALLTHMPRRAVLHVHAALLQMVSLPVPSAPPSSLTPSASNGRGKLKIGANGKLTTGGGGGAEFAWQVRHGGLVGIKYEVAVRPDLFDDVDVGAEVLRGVVEAALSGYVPTLTTDDGSKSLMMMRRLGWRTRLTTSDQLRRRASRPLPLILSSV